jgi:hypothetical protein
MNRKVTDEQKQEWRFEVTQHDGRLVVGYAVGKRGRKSVRIIAGNKSEFAYRTIVPVDEWDCAPKSLEDAKRIRACVNACRGTADPAAEIAALRAQRDDLLECTRLLALVCAEGQFQSERERVEMLEQARAAIAKAKGERTE